jgi:hypothetical protein
MITNPEGRFILHITIWTAICLIFVESLEVLFVLLLLGILVLRELADPYLSYGTKDRINFFIYTSSFVFAVIVARKVYLILSAA